jgi:hypothetical protein
LVWISRSHRGRDFRSYLVLIAVVGRNEAVEAVKYMPHS